MEESSSPPPLPPPSPGEELRTGFASFDATSFFEIQEKERDRKAADLLAAADALCPSSSEDTSSSSDDEKNEEEIVGEHEEGEVIDEVGQKRKSAGTKPESNEKRLKKRKKKHSRKSKESGKKERRRREKIAEAEFARHVTAELAAGEASRKSSLHPLAFSDSSVPEQQQGYYSEKRPDPGNIAFGKLYRFDVPRYRRYDPTGYIARLLKLGSDDTANDKGGVKDRKIGKKEKIRKKVTMWWKPIRRRFDGKSIKEFDFTVSDASGYVTLDPTKDKTTEQQICGAAEERQQEGGRSATEETFFSSPEEYLLHKTRDFNAQLRQTPENLQLWLDFSAFQEEVMEISGGIRRRGAVRATSEKQIAILESGLEHHPGSDILLLALLDVASKMCYQEEMEKRWQRVLASRPGSLKLWKTYLRKKRCQFANFKAANVATAHYQALSALKHEKSRLEHLASSLVGSQSSIEEIESVKSQLTELDHALVEVLLLKISFHLQTGNTELGIAAMRALLEYTWFAPDGWPEDALEMMFEQFYSSYIEDKTFRFRRDGNSTRNSKSSGNLKMIGDAGASGWGVWITGDGDSMTGGPSAKEDEEEEGGGVQEEEKQGGWVEVPREETKVAPLGEEGLNLPKQDGKDGEKGRASEVSPWEELAPAIQARFGHALKTTTTTMEEEEGGDINKSENKAVEGEIENKDEEEEELDMQEQEETDEQLLARLGMDLDAVLADEEEELTPAVLSTWLDIECQRDAQQWEANSRNILISEKLENLINREDKEEGKELEDEVEENPFNQVTWEDIAPYIVSISNYEAREKLLTGCLQLLGVPESTGGAFNSSAVESLVESQDEMAAAASWLGIGGASLEAVDPCSIISSGISVGSEWAWLNDCSVVRNHAVRDMPWWAATKQRHSFTVNLLTTLMKNKILKNKYELAFATLNLASWKIPPPSSTASSLAQQQKPTRDWAAGRALAKQLLSEQRDNLVLYAAFAALEKLSGRNKAARKVYSACLSGLPKNLPGEGRALPAGLVELVLGLSQLELEDATAVGKKENIVERSSFPISMLSLLRATPQALYAAARPLLFLGSRGKICLETSAPEAAVNNNVTPQDEIVVARRGYQDGVLRLLRAGAKGCESQEAVTHVSAAAVAELVFAACSIEDGGITSRSNIGGGVTAALALYKQVVDALSSNLSPSSLFLKRVEIQRCALAVDAAVHAVHVMPPILARERVLEALHRYPSSPPLLRMLRFLEVNAHALTALRRHLNSILSSSPSVPAWLMLVGVEIGASASRTAVRAALLRALNHPSGMHSPLLWRCSLRFERAFGTPESLHRTFLRAVEACPWSKSLWCDGLEFLNGFCSPKGLSEYLAIMKDKELAVRTDVLEAVLAQLN